MSGMAALIEAEDSVPEGDLVAETGADADLPAGRFSNRETVLAGLQRAGARPGRGPPPAAARADEVPRDLRQQPRRVLHGAGRRAEAAGGHGPADALTRRADPARGARHARRPHRDAGRPARPLLPRRRRPEARRPRASTSAGGTPWTTRRSSGWASTSRARSSPSSPRSPSTRHTRSPTSPGCRSTSPSWCATRARAARSASPGSRCPTTCRGSWWCRSRPSRRSSCRWRTSSPRTWRCCSPACRSSSTTCSASPATPTSRSRRTATRTCCRRSSAS